MSSGSNTTSTSFDFEVIFDAALTEYTKRTGKDLRDHPLATKIDSCDNPESILDIFQEQAQAFDKFRKGDPKLFKWLRPVIDVLHAVSTNETISKIASNVFPPAKAVFSAIDILFSTAKDVRESYDALVDIFECIENFLRRLNIYINIPPTSAIPLTPAVLTTPAMAEMVIKIMAELIAVLALATKQMKQGPFKKYARTFLGEKDIKSVLDRLDRLTLEESKITTAETFNIVYRLVNKMQVVMEDGEASAGDIRETLVLMQELVTDARKTRRDQFQEKVRGWLSAPDPSVNQNTARKAHHHGTATWFTQGDVLKKWKSEGSLMWIHGLPGSGKSVLCSSIIEDVQAMCPTGLATLIFFYFDFRDIGKQDARSLLSSLLTQLCYESDKFSDLLSSLLSTHGNGTRQPSEGVLLECLKDMLKLRRQGELYIVVDALDECPDVSGYPTPRAEVLKILEQLVGLRLPQLHLCITSRPEPDIRGALEGLATYNVSLHEQAGQNQDIVNYIESVISSEPKIRRWREEDRKLVKATLTERACGMFRWVYCQIETLIRCFPPSIGHALDELPKTLDETYEQSLRRIDKEKLDFACRLFQCLVISKRPLLVEELAELFAIQPNDETIPTFDARCRPENPEEFVLSACSTLVAIINNGGQKIVQFSHYSVREYLTSDRIAFLQHVQCFHVPLRPAHALLAGACLSVLLELDDRIVRDEIQDFPLAPYAARYWVDHAQFDDVASEIQLGMESLFDKDKPHFAAWNLLYNIDDQYSHRIPPRSVPLYYAVLCGFRHLTEHLVKAHPQDVNAQGGRHVTPLHAALDEGHPSLAMLLLERGADIESQGSQSRTPLHTASYHGYADVVSALIYRGANTNTETDNRETPLYLASQYGKLDVAKLLLEHKATQDHQNAEGFTPLRAAWQAGHVDNVRLLLRYGADPKFPDNRSKSPLHVILQESHYSDISHPGPPAFSSPGFLDHRLDVVTLLLELGADANYPDSDGETSLHVVLRRGLIDIVPLLLKHGADANHPDNHGETSLHIALRRGLFDIVPLLLDHGANTNHPGNHRETSLHIALRRGLIDIVSLLLKHGADANYPSNYGVTALHIALRRGLIDIVPLLLNHGADANCPDDHGETSLHIALRRDLIDIIPLLLNHGADANHPDNHDETSLHIALQRGLIVTIPLLLNHGADANHLGNHGETSLHIALRRGLIDIARLLLNHGADANYPDNHGETPLHITLRRGLIDIVQLLLNHGADACHPDEFGITPLHVALQMDDEIIRSLLDFYGSDNRTLLHAASQKGHDDIVESLLNHGVDANHPDNDGLTALHTASREGHDYIALLLIYYGADANRSDNDGRSPLHAAVSPNGHKTVVQLLLDHGAAADHPDRDGWTPLHAASQEGHDDIVRLLLDHGAAPNHQDNRGRTPLHVAWKKGDKYHTSPYLLRTEVGANCLGGYGWTLLPRVSKRSINNDIVRLLLKHGADANLPDSSGLTPLYLALQAGTATTSTSYHSVMAQD